MCFEDESVANIVPLLLNIAFSYSCFEETFKMIFSIDLNDKREVFVLNEPIRRRPVLPEPVRLAVSPCAALPHLAPCYVLILESIGSFNMEYTF